MRISGAIADRRILPLWLRSGVDSRATLETDDVHRLHIQDIQRTSRSRSAKRSRGMTLLELMVVISIVGIIAASAGSYLGSWREDQELASTARSFADVFNHARAEAMRTGSNHLVVFRIEPVSTQDAAGNDIEDVLGNEVTALVVMDMFGGAENCALDDGDQRTAIAITTDFDWGVTNATVRAPLDAGQPGIAGGSSFARPTAPATAINAVMFGPTGIPVTFDADGTGCLSFDAVGSGGGALYITNGDRDYALVQSPLGGNRVHAWNPDAGAWSN